MRKETIIFWAVFTCCFGNLSYAQKVLNLDKGFLPPEPASASNPEYVKSRHLEIAVATSSSPDKDGFVVAFANPEGGSNYYLLTETPFVHEVKSSDDQYVGGWPLTLWSHQYQEPEIVNRREKRDFPNELSLSEGGSLGCLSKTPLRYGDINDNGQSELVLTLNSTILVFSPESENVIFSAEINVDDWMNAEDTAYYYDNSIGKAPDGSSAQYLSGIYAYTSRGEGREPGYRGYGKLYLDDFDGNGKHDIVLWKKLYISRLRGDETKGFEHLRDTLIHYELIDSEYQPQDTEEDVIQSWLADKNLTWQKGYPTKSECEGREGELIPQMHDPLLNDPQVLR